MPVAYPDFSWSVRVVRVLVVAAVAVLAGAVIGGVSVYLINDALTAPPESQIRTDVSRGKETTAANNPSSSSAQTAIEPTASATNAQSQPIRTIDPSLPAPAVAPTPQASSPTAPAASAPTSPTADTSTSSMPSSPAQTAEQPQLAQPRSALSAPPEPAPTQTAPSTASQAAPSAEAAHTSAQAAQTSWPDALSRAHPSTADAPETENPVPAARTTEQTPNSGENAVAARAAPPHEDQSANQSANQSAAARNETVSARQAVPAKKRITVTRTTQPTTGDVSETQSAKRRPMYDYYDDTADREHRSERQDVGSASDKATVAQPNFREPYTRRSANKMKQRVIVRQQDDSDRQDERTNGRVTLPPQPQPAQSFFGGLFGGDRDDDSR